MAKGKGVFLSLTATGSILKTLVASSWKGIPVIRGWVKPSNPNTPAMQFQRGIVRTGNVEWKATNWGPGDLISWRRLASIRPSSETGMNQFMREYIRVLRSPDFWRRLWNGDNILQGNGDLFIRIKGDGGLGFLTFMWGFSKTAMTNVVAATGYSAPHWYYIITSGSIPSGSDIYWRAFDGADIASSQGNTGIYTYNMP